MAIKAETRAIINHLTKIKGMSLRKVATECNVSQTTLWRIKHTTINGNTNNKQQKRKETRGRPRKLTPRDARQLRRTISTLREQEGGFTVQRLMKQANIEQKNVSPCTVNRNLNEQGYYCLQARKKGLLTAKDLKTRRIFSRKMRKDYSQEVWTKEIAFYLDGTGFAYKTNPLDQALAPRARVWRKRSEGLNFRCTAKGQKTGSGGKVLKLIVAISYNKRVIFCKPYEKMSGIYFEKFIDENFNKMFNDAAKGRRRLWIQDGDPSQNSARARAAMQRARSELIKIPPRSPDLNPIENIFKIVSDLLRKQALERRIQRERLRSFKIV